MNTGLIAGPDRGVLLSLCDKEEGFEGTVVANLLPDGRLIRHRVPLSEPGPMAVGPDGAIWAVRTLDKKSFPVIVYRIDSDGGRESFSLDQVKEAREPFSEFRIRDLVVDDDGTAWVATADLTDSASAYNSYGGDLVHITPGSTVEAFPLPQGEPENLEVGIDGNLWFTAISDKYRSQHSSTPSTGFVGRFTTAGEFTLFPTPIAHGEPEAIATAPDGTLWFTEPAVGRIGTVGLDGNFGRDYRVRFGYLGNPEITARQGGLVFDPWAMP
jgi:virginiamycin B lyase